MMTATQHRWLWIGAGVAAVAAALALGVPLGSVLIVAAALAFPLAIYVGMRGMGVGQDCRHEGMHGHREDGLPEKRTRVSQGEPHGW
jgi:hypothetical protein